MTDSSQMPDASLMPLPTDPKAFYCAGEGAEALTPAPADAPSALERLGPSPFPKAKFPFLGFLASVYDHVSSHARARGGETPAGGGATTTTGE